MNMIVPKIASAPALATPNGTTRPQVSIVIVGHVDQPATRAKRLDEEIADAGLVVDDEDRRLGKPRPEFGLARQILRIPILRHRPFLP